PCCSRLRPCGWWGSAEYVHFWRKSRFFPPLVTTNPLAVPVLSDPNTRILFGNEKLGGGSKSGAKGDFGVWISRCLGAGASLLVLADEKIDFEINGGPTGTPILGQPFFNTVAGAQDVVLISFPLLAFNGHIDIASTNRFWTGDLYLRRRYV